MRSLLMGMVFGTAMLVSGKAAFASEQWQESHYNLPQALAAGYIVVSNYHNSEGHLVFVLQRQNVLLMCAYAVQQSTHCAQLGKEL